MAQQGPATKIYLADLTIQPTKVAICVRVVRKWIFNGNVPGAAPRYIGLVLADQKGDSIYAEIPQMHVPRLGPLVQNDKVYEISKFTVRTSKSGYVPFERKYMIEFNAYTFIKEATNPPDTFPTHVYHLTPFCNINPFGSSGTKLIDILGIVCSVEAPKPLRLPKKERVATIREIVIKNESNEDLKVTLWDDRATEFMLPAAAVADVTQSVVVLFVGCQPTTLNKVIQVYGGAACQWYFNPRISEAQPLYNRLQLSPVPIYRPPAQLSDAHEVVEPIIIEHKTLAQLNQIDPYEIPKARYKCTVTITQIYETPRWWYVGCAKCGKAPEIETVPFVCRCGWKESTPLYKLNFQAKDDTSEARFFCYDTISRRIIKRNINFMLRQSKQTVGLPQHLNNLVSKKYTFVVGVTASSFQDPNVRTYLVKTVAVDYQEQAYMANQMHMLQTTTQAAGSPTTVPLIPLLPSSSSGLLNEAETLADSPDTTGTKTPPPIELNDDTPTKDGSNRSAHTKSAAAKVLFSMSEPENKVISDSNKAAAVQQMLHPATEAHVMSTSSAATHSMLGLSHSEANTGTTSVDVKQTQEAPCDSTVAADDPTKQKDTEEVAPASICGTKRPRSVESASTSKSDGKKAGAL